MERGELPQRRSIRLREFDYRRNHAYFVTICTVQKLCLFGEAIDGEIRLSDIGRVVDSAWQDLPNHTDGLLLDVWVVMPNHLHGIVLLPGVEGSKPIQSSARFTSQPGTLGTVMGGFKSAVSREVNANNLTLVRPIWQRNYYERIIRNDCELNATRRYIMDNPLRWTDDPDHPRHHQAANKPPGP